jgi:hypothetical protein
VISVPRELVGVGCGRCYASTAGIEGKVYIGINPLICIIETNRRLTYVVEFIMV